MTHTEEPDGADVVGRRALLAILVGLMLGMFLGALDTMIMATALRTVADQLDGLTLQAWVTTAFLVTMTVSAPMYGKLSDIYGRRPLYLIAVTLFLVGSLLCGISASIYQLAGARAVQGLGAGGLTALALAVVADIAPSRKRARYQANLGAVFAVASVAGPVLGGLFAGASDILGVAGWRWIFLINLPIGAVAFVLVAVLLKVPHRRVRHRIDYAGAVTLVLGVFPLLLVAEHGRSWGWTSAATLSLTAAGVVMLAIFVMVEGRVGDSALLPRRLFRGVSFPLVSAVNFLGGVGVFSGLALLPLYLQLVKDYSPTMAGLLLLPQSVATTVGARICEPLIERIDYRRTLATGVALMCAVFLALSQVGLGTPLWLMIVMVTVLGLGMGMYFQVTLIAIQNSVPRSDIGLASGLYNFTRQIGGVTGTAVFVTLLFILAESRVGGADLDDTSFLSGLGDLAARPIREGINSSLNIVFAIVAGFLALSAVLATLLPKTRDAAEQDSVPADQPAH